MADITNLFKAQVKTLKLRNRSLKEIKSDENDDKQDNAAHILKKKKQENNFELKAKELVKTITKLNDLLTENRKDYVNSGSLLSSQANVMTEAERDQIDKDAQTIIKSCRDAIFMFKTDTERQKDLPQVREHKNAALNLVETYLKSVCKCMVSRKL